MIPDSAEIAKLRKSKGMTLKQFGELLGVSEATASRWETGHRHPRYHILVKLVELSKNPARKRELSGAK